MPSSPAPHPPPFPTRRSSDLLHVSLEPKSFDRPDPRDRLDELRLQLRGPLHEGARAPPIPRVGDRPDAGVGRNESQDRKSTRLNSSHLVISYAVFCLRKKSCC